MKNLQFSNAVNWNSHRYGWKYVIKGLRKIEISDEIILDGFVDATFGCMYNEYKSKNIIPYKKKWAGFFHHPPNIPPWLNQESIAPKKIIENVSFQNSLSNCIGIFTFSKYLSTYLQSLIDIPIVNLIHPTGRPQLLFNFELFKLDRKIIHVGSWLRKITSFYLVQAVGYEKYMLLNSSTAPHLKREIQYYNFDINKYKDVCHLDHVDNKTYDMIMSESVIFLNLYDSSVNNTVLECIARNTPVVVNKLPSIVEYLGENYPLYYTNLDEITELLTDSNVQSAHEYIKQLTIKKKININFFKKSFLNSTILQQYKTK